MFRSLLLVATFAALLPAAASETPAAPAAPVAQATFEVVHHFRESDGWDPNSNLVQGRHGKLYGTTRAGGSGQEGVVFRISPGGLFSVAHEFSRDDRYEDGFEPRSGLIELADGSFVGTTKRGGAGFGTVFKITPEGQYTVLHRFAGRPDDGAYPVEELLLASDGYLYGTTTRGGKEDIGAVYRISPSGEESLFYNLGRGKGRAPSPLIEASDGNFYGLTSVGRAVVFRIAPEGQFEVFHRFSINDSDSDFPAAPLLQAADGYLYGVGSASPHYFGGALFRLSLDGKYTVLHRFNGIDNNGEYPLGGLVQASNGQMYGSTCYGGFRGDGVIYRVRTEGGHPEFLHEFSGSDGDCPTGGLVQASNGWLYGTTISGGKNGLGTVFRIKP